MANIKQGYPKEHGHEHGEAFALMWYACKCGHREKLWNSRDGVAPFCIGCTSCNKNMAQHTDWRLDEYAPNHKLAIGQRYFRNGTTEEAVGIMERRLERMKDDYPTTPEEREEILTEVCEGKCHEFQAGWPTIDTQGLS